MNCRQFNDRLDAYLDGDLAAAERSALDAHADACPGCRRQGEAQRLAERALRTPEFRAAPPGMLAEFHRRLDAAAPARRPRFPWPWAAGTALAAAGAALLLITFGPVRFGHDEGGSPAAKREGSQLAFQPRNEDLAAAMAPRTAPPGRPAAPAAGESRPVAPRDPESRLAEAKLQPPRERGMDDERGFRHENTGRRPAILARRPRPAREPVPPVPLHRVDTPGGRADQATAPPDPDDLSPAIVSALNRSVSISVMGEPAERAVEKLVEAGDVLVSVDARAVSNNVSLSFENAPLWQALESVAAQSNLRIEASGDGLRLAMPPATRKEEERLRLLDEARAADQVAAPAIRKERAAGGRAAQATRPLPGKLSPRRQAGQVPAPEGNAQQRAAVWGPALSQLRAQNFVQPLAQLQEELPQFGRSGLSVTQAPAAGGLGGFAGAPEEAAAPRPAGPAPGGSTAADDARRRVERMDLAARTPPPAPAAKPAPAGRPMALERERGLADGELLLVRSADGRRFAALQILGQEGGRLRYRLWSYQEGRWSEPVERTASASPRGNDTVRVPVLGGNLEWNPAAGGGLRPAAGALKLLRTGLHELQGLDPRDPRWKW